MSSISAQKYHTFQALEADRRLLISYNGVYDQCAIAMLCYAMLNKTEGNNASGALDMTIRYPGYPHTLPLT